jgi:hypothetical protein
MWVLSPFCKWLTVVLERHLMTGLAEAGLISSNLSKTGVEDNGIHTGVLFEPDSPLSRQDLVSWKVALDRRELLSVNKEVW